MASHREDRVGRDVPVRASLVDLGRGGGRAGAGREDEKGRRTSEHAREHLLVVAAAAESVTTHLCVAR